MIPDKLSITLNQAMEENLELAEIYKSGQEKEKQLIQIALRLEGLNSNLSTHAAGIIIMDTDISTRIPLCTSKEAMKLNLNTVWKMLKIKEPF